MSTDPYRVSAPSTLSVPPSQPDLASVGWIELHLGTRVEISGKGHDRHALEAAIEAAFAEVALIHRLMSFHCPHSDVTRLNRGAARRPVQVDERTVAVLRAAQRISRKSQGHFDVTVAPQLVSAGLLPSPCARVQPAAAADWRDIELLDERWVRFRRPLWLDLGGIAKGYAVDKAQALLQARGVEQAVVNAGGDLRVSDGPPRAVALDPPPGLSASRAYLALSGGSLASSCARDAAGLHRAHVRGPHVDGITRAPLREDCFVSVLARDCMIADALTKVVLLLRREARPLLEQVLAHYAATAFLLERGGDWEALNPAQAVRHGGADPALGPASRAAVSSR